ncbi:hypothetical protein HDU93_006817, partial [Gonapodya sp. JEL0774]
IVLATNGYFIRSLRRNPPDDDAERQKSRLRKIIEGNSRVVIMEGSHHLHLETRARECGELVADFMEDRSGARSRLGWSGSEVVAGKTEEWQSAAAKL